MSEASETPAIPPGAANTGEPAKEQSLVPSLTKETWELLQFRVEKSVDKKLWTIVPIALAVLTLLGWFGMGAWLNAKVDAGLKQQREGFERVRESYEARAEGQLLATGLLFSLQQRTLADSANYRLKAAEVRSKVTAAQLAELQKFSGIANILNSVHTEKPTREEFAAQLEAASLKFPNLGTVKERDSTIGQLAELRNWSIHIVGLQAALRAVGRDVFSGAKANPSALGEYYEKKVYPEYAAVLKRGTHVLGWAGSGDAQVNSLSPDSRLELNFFIPSAYDAYWK